MPIHGPTGSMLEVAGMHRDLRARAWIAGDSPDLDDAFVDLGHLLGEQLGHELRMGARQKHLRTTRLLTHVHDISADTVAGVEVLARDSLLAPQQRLGAPQVDDHVAELDPLDQAIDDVAHAILELVVLPVALRLAHLMNDHLFGGLRRDTAEVDRRQRIDDELAESDRGQFPASRRQRNLRRLVLDGLDHLEEPRQRNLPGRAIYVGANVMVVAILRPAGFLNSLFHRLEHFLAVDALVAGDGIRDLQQFGAGVNCVRFHGHSVHRPSYLSGITPPR